MGKKYQPNGYQIIDISINSNGIVQTEETELLYDIIDSLEYKKPILVHIYNSDEAEDIVGYLIGRGDSASIFAFDGVRLVIYMFVCGEPKTISFTRSEHALQ